MMVKTVILISMLTQVTFTRKIMELGIELETSKDLKEQQVKKVKKVTKVTKEQMVQLQLLPQKIMEMELTLSQFKTLMVLNQQLLLKMVKTVKLLISLQQKTQMEATQSLSQIQTEQLKKLLLRMVKTVRLQKLK